MRIFLCAVLTAVALLAAPAAMAQSRAAESTWGGYLSLQGAATLLQDADNEGDPFSSGLPDVSIESSYDLGYSVSAALGYSFQTPILSGRVGPLFPRLELEIAWRSNDIDELKIKNDGGLGEFLGIGSLNGFSRDASGEMNSLSALYNVWIDIVLPRPKSPYLRPVVPYFGGGIGAAGVWANDVKVAGVKIIDDGDVEFAYQLGAGVGVEVTDWLVVTLDYRWMGTTQPRLKTEFDGKFDSEYSSHNLGMGLRYYF